MLGISNTALAAAKAPSVMESVITGMSHSYSSLGSFSEFPVLTPPKITNLINPVLSAENLLSKSYLKASQAFSSFEITSSITKTMEPATNMMGNFTSKVTQDIFIIPALVFRVERYGIRGGSICVFT